MDQRVTCGGEVLLARGLWIAATISLLHPAMGGAQGQDPRRPEVFARELVDAVHSKDAERRLGIVHPLSRACMTPQTQPYYDWIFSRQARHVIPSAYTVRATPLPQGAPATADGHSDYPVRPTHQLQIDFVPAPHSSTGVIVLVVFDDGRWREVLPCPRGDVVGRAKARQVEEAERDRRAQALAAQISPHLRAELLDLLRAGRRVDAIRRYSRSRGSAASSTSSTSRSGETARGTRS